MRVLAGIFTGQMLQYSDRTDIRAQRKPSTPTGVAHAETLGLRGASQFYNRQVLPTTMIAHMKVNEGATAAGDRYARGSAWRTARPSRTRF